MRRPSNVSVTPSTVLTGSDRECVYLVSTPLRQTAYDKDDGLGSEHRYHKPFLRFRPVFWGEFADIPVDGMKHAGKAPPYKDRQKDRQYSPIEKALS